MSQPRVRAARIGSSSCAAGPSSPGGLTRGPGAVRRPVPIGEQLAGGTPAASFSVSRPEVLVYRSFDSDSRLVWLDRAGAAISTAGPPASYGRRAFRRTGGRVTGQDRPGRTARDLWLLDLVRGSTSRLTFGIGRRSHPSGRPTARKVPFGSPAGQARHLRSRPAEGPRAAVLELPRAQAPAMTGRPTGVPDPQRDFPGARTAERDLVHRLGGSSRPGTPPGTAVR